MSCEHLKMRTEDGREINAIVCMRGRRPKFCSVGFCNKPSVALCDYPVERKGKRATCDSPMCEQHRHPVPGQPDTDWCEGHYHLDKKWKAETPKGELPLTFDE